jgi:hypothetical protein
MSLVLLLAGAASAAPLTFTDATSASVVTTTVQQGDLDKEYALGDFDRDGDLDVVLAIADGIFGRRQNMVYLNDNGVLREESTNLVPEFWNDTLSRRPFLKDLDGDGWLDLIVVNDTLAAGYAGLTHLWMNNHPGGVFQGFVQDDARLNGASGASCGASMQDFDGDGDEDLYIGNYPGPSQDTFYLNSGAGTFSEVTSTHVPVDSDYTTDVLAADFNGDGLLDISLGNEVNPSFIYYNNLNGQTVDGDFSSPGSTQQTRQRTTYHNATEAIDADGDGDLDLYMANYQSSRDALFINEGNINGVVDWRITSMDGRVSNQETSKPTVVDINDDGRMDLLVPAQDGRPVLLRNTSIGGVASFMEWTPPDILDGQVMSAYSAAVFDVDGDDVHDIVLFGHQDEHVFLGSAAPTYDASTLGGVLPDTADGPIVIEGSGEAGRANLLVSTAAVPGATYVTIAKACGDIGVYAGDESGQRNDSDRATFGNEEVTRIGSTSGRIGVSVVVHQACGDANGDGDVDRFDFQAAAQCVANPTDACVAMFDADLDGQLTLDDRDILLADSRGRGQPALSRYTLEVLTR